MNFKEPTGQLARWLERLSQYHFVVEHRPGTKHANADALSRRPPTIEEPEVQHIGCTRVEQSSKGGFDLGKLQAEDPDIGPIMAAMTTSKDRPLWKKFEPASQKTRSYWTQWDSLVLEKGVLYRLFRYPSEPNPRYQLVVPRCMMTGILHELHNNQFGGGHLGVYKTTRKVRARYYWAGLKEDTNIWVKCCESCSARKHPPKTRQAPLESIITSYPMERVAIDILGPLPLTERGNKYILVAQEYFTKWVEAYAIPNQESETILQKLVDEFFCRFGFPVYLHSDQAQNFNSNVFMDLCSALGIHKTRTTAYHPECDGMVERFMKSVSAMLSHYVSTTQRDWDEVLPKVLLAYRTSVHQTTGFTPNGMFLGREVFLPVDIIYGDPNVVQQKPAEYVWETRKSLEISFDSVRQNTSRAQRHQKRLYDRKLHGSGYNEGD